MKMYKKQEFDVKFVSEIVACYMRSLPWWDNKNPIPQHGQPTENLTKKELFEEQQ